MGPFEKMVEASGTAKKFRMAYHAIRMWYIRNEMEDVADQFALEDLEKLIEEMREKYPHLNDVQLASVVTRKAKQTHGR